MTTTIFNEIIRRVDIKMMNLKKKILLLMDNAPSHKVTKDLEIIKILTFVVSVQ